MSFYLPPVHVNRTFNLEDYAYQNEPITYREGDARYLIPLQKIMSNPNTGDSSSTDKINRELLELSGNIYDISTGLVITTKDVFDASTAIIVIGNKIATTDSHVFDTSSALYITNRTATDISSPTWLSPTGQQLTYLSICP